MPSNINPDHPTLGTATTASVRTNFQHAKDEIEALQAAGGVDYSNDETPTGELWIGNRPVYRKVFTIPGGKPANEGITVPHGIANIYLLIRAAVVTAGSAGFGVNERSTAYISGANILVDFQTAAAVPEVHIIIDYVKL